MSKLKDALLSEKKVIGNGKYELDEIVEQVDGKFEEMAFTMETIMMESYISSGIKRKLHKMIKDMENIRADIVKDLGE